MGVLTQTLPVYTKSLQWLCGIGHTHNVKDTAFPEDSNYGLHVIAIPGADVKDKTLY